MIDFVKLSLTNYSQLNWQTGNTLVISNFQSACVDHFIGGHFNIHTFNKFFGEFTLNILKDINLKNSNSTQNCICQTGGNITYLKSLQKIWACRLITLTRTNCQPQTKLLWEHILSMKANVNYRWNSIQFLTWLMWWLVSG